MPFFSAAGTVTRPYVTAALALTVAIALAIVTAYVLLIPIGNWRNDEFDTLYYIREYGLSFIWGRIRDWSPRPLSEILIYGYGSLVDATGQPQVGLFLGGLWLLLIAALFVPVATIARRRHVLLVPTGTLAIVVMALFLVGHRVDEVFFWTQGAAAYMATLAAIAFLVMLHLCSDNTSPKAMYLSAFVAATAALSSEMGASFALAYGGCMLLANVAGLRGSTISSNLRGVTFESVVPILVGLLVFYLVANGRMTISKEVVGDVQVARHLLPSFWVALDFMPREIWS